MKALVITAGLALGAIANGQENPAAAAARAWRATHERAILSEFLDLLALPNVAPANPALDSAGIRRNAAAVIIHPLMQ